MYECGDVAFEGNSLLAVSLSCHIELLERCRETISIPFRRSHQLAFGFAFQSLKRRCGGTICLTWKAFSRVAKKKFLF